MIDEKREGIIVMVRSQALYVAAASCILVFAPGLVQKSFAAGSAFEQQKADEESREYKALNVSPAYNTDARGYSEVSRARAAAPLPGATSDDNGAAWVPQYRGGREY